MYSKKQSCIALSTMETKCIACSTVVKEAVWLRIFLQHLDVVTQIDEPVEMLSDSMAALEYLKDPKYHGRTKHIDIRFYYIQEMTRPDEVTLRHISTARIVVDPLTKPIAKDIFQIHVRSLGLYRF